jgi:transposase
MDHIGIDVHKTESQLCILGEEGQLSESRIRTTPEWFAAVLGDRPRACILLEASTESEWVARCLEQLGHEVIVADPNFAPMYAAVGRSRRIAATPERWPRPADWEPTAPPIGSPTPSGMCAGA